MGVVRRLLLTALPKLALSRTTRVLARMPLPRPLRRPLFGAYAKRYGAALDEMTGSAQDYATFAAFFQRTLRPGARPVAPSPLVWPADGRVVGSGPIEGERLPQVKGIDYALADLVLDADLAAALRGGSQATVYLAPGDYHRVHAPFDGAVVATRHVPGGLFPVNAGAVASIPELFVRNERHVVEMRLDDGRRAAVVLVAALNVSDTELSCPLPGRLAKGDEVGRFGLGSTVVALLAPGRPAFARFAVGTQVRMGEAATAADGA